MPITKRIKKKNTQGMSCSHPTWGGQAYQAIQWVPFIVPFAISMAAFSVTPSGHQHKMRPVKQINLMFFGFWLIVVDWIVYIMQMYFNRQRHDPYCMDQLHYMFPSRISFYLAVLVTYVVLFTYLWDAELHWLYWSTMFLIFVAPQALLVWLEVNAWQEVLLSTIMGIITTAYFMIMFRFFINDMVPYLVHQRPWTWFSAADTWTSNRWRQLQTLEIGATLRRLNRYF